MARPDHLLRPTIFASLLRLMPPGRMLDVACGHGVFSLMAADLGWEVTAVDVRTGRMQMTEGITWVESDVRDFPIAAGDYDCIAVLGLLYHLELDDQMDLLRRCASTPTILDTHVALEPDTEVDGYRGIHFDEVAGRTDEEFDNSPTASWKNRTSFWADEPSLLRQLSDAGFGSVHKHVPSYEDDRAFYLCLPPLADDPYPRAALARSGEAELTAAAPPVKRSWLGRRRAGR